jgi:hypothetical protein
MAGGPHQKAGSLSQIIEFRPRQKGESCSRHTDSILLKVA